MSSREILKLSLEKSWRGYEAFLLLIAALEGMMMIYGHPEGDLSLIYIANVLTDFFGKDVFRYGGDEFAVISFEDAGLVAEKMALVNLRPKENSTEYVLQVCAGVYQNTAQDDERRIFELADSALYEAKQTGKAHSVIYRAPLNGV